MIKFKPKLKRPLAGVIFSIVALAVFVVARPVQAQIAAALVTGVRDIVQMLVGNLVLVYVQFIGFLLLMVIQILIAVAQYNNFVDSAVVVNGWSIVRDISNMFFILILLYIAFATILGVGGVDWKQRLPKLLIFAILINFTRVIAGLMIDFGQVIMITFVNGFKDAAGGNFADLLGIRNLMQLSASGTLAAPGSLETSATDLASVLGGLIGAALFATIAFIVIIVITLVLVYRMVMLWIYVVLSPLAFIMGAFPQGESYYAQWWKQFSSTIILGPMLAFFLWLSLLTVGTITQGINTSVTTVEGGQRKIDVVCGPNAICQTDSVLAFIVGIGLLMGGLTISQSIAGSAGGGMSNIIGAGRNMMTGAIKRFTGVKAVQDVYKGYKEEREKAKGKPFVERIGAGAAGGVNEAMAALGSKKAQEFVGQKQAEKDKKIQAAYSQRTDKDVIEKARIGDRNAAMEAARRKILTSDNGFTPEQIKAYRNSFGYDKASEAQFIQAALQSDPTTVRDISNPEEREQLFSEMLTGRARKDKLPAKVFEGDTGKAFAERLSEQTSDEITSFAKGLKKDGKKALLARMEESIASSAPGQDNDLRTAYADLSGKPEAAFANDQKGMDEYMEGLDVKSRERHEARIARAQGTPPQTGGQPPPGGAPPPPAPRPSTPPSGGGSFGGGGFGTEAKGTERSVRPPFAGGPATPGGAGPVGGGAPSRTPPSGAPLTPQPTGPTPTTPPGGGGRVEPTVVPGNVGPAEASGEEVRRRRETARRDEEIVDDTIAEIRKRREAQKPPEQT